MYLNFFLHSYTTTHFNLIFFLSFSLSISLHHLFTLTFTTSTQIHFLNVARALRFQAQFPIQFWGECALAACYLINRTPTRNLNGKTPFELLYDKRPSLEHLRVIGCLTYAHNQHHKGDKFAARSRKCVFVGYPYGTKGWRMYDLELGVFFNSRDVVFCENEFPFAAEIPSENDHILPGASFSNDIEDDFFQLVPTIPAVPSTPAIETATLLDKDVSSVTPPVSIESPAASSSFDSQNMSSFAETSEEPQAADTIEDLGRGHRIKLPSTKLQDFVTNTITKICPSNCSTASSRPSGTPYPLAKYVNYANFSPRHRKFLADVSAATEPQNFAEAVKNIQW